MENTLITKQQAVQIVGSEVELKRVCRKTPHGETAMLQTGAKLFTTRRGAVLRYGVYGYCSDGCDVTAILDALAAGETHLLIGQYPGGKVARHHSAA